MMHKKLVNSEMFDELSARMRTNYWTRRVDRGEAA